MYTVVSVKELSPQTEKMFANHLSDKGLGLEYTWNTENSTRKQIIQLEDDQKSDRHLTKEGLWMTNKHMKRHPTSYVIRKPVECHHINPQTGNPSADQYVEQQKSYTLLAGTWNSTASVEHSCLL